VPSLSSATYTASSRSSAKFAEAGDKKLAGLVTFGLEPVARFAAAIEAAAPFRHDAFAAGPSDRLEQHAAASSTFSLKREVE
jgi:hypothetical protein